MKVGIIGMGWVGSSVAISTLHDGLADELLLNDLDQDLAEGEVMDLVHGGSFFPDCTIRVAEPDEMREADAVVVAAGRGGKPNETRLDLTRENAEVTRSIGESLKGAKGVIVMVTNPVDVLTHVMQEATGLSRDRVIGTGTTLDTARLRELLAQRLSVASRSVHAQVVGEHGDSSVCLWSGASIGGRALRDWPGWSRDDEPAIRDKVRRAATEIIKRKGATNHAIGLVTASVLRAIRRDERRVLTVSRVQEEVAGVKDVALSLPALVGAEGVVDVLRPMMDADERDALARSAEVIQKATSEVR